MKTSVRYIGTCHNSRIPNYSDMRISISECNGKHTNLKIRCILTHHIIKLLILLLTNSPLIYNILESLNQGFAPDHA
ncbi:hypothetical protein BpHYR1_031732 [Brachionus plicatilis]|uniref:Uncharacterized protein n=1 Tax=Brachionus plicatilis TaxID=10195 RepID=A0A3M7PYW1_BRAPC|nr:hypothetical protein BpHYR1_031732 [Brachionus plicatilis]